MRYLLALGLLMTLCASASAASGVRNHSTVYSKNYGQYSGHFSRNYGHSSQYQYYGSPNNRGGLVGGDDAGT
jgi:hypothetical protein